MFASIRIANLQIIFFSFLSVCFSSAPVVMTFDSAWYHKYLNIIKGGLPWAEWDYVRGVALPLLLNLSHSLFGNSSQGIVVLMGILYLIASGLALAITKSVVSRAIVLIFFVLNPLVFGYFHVFLPEPFGIFFAVLLLFLLSRSEPNLKLAVLLGLLLIVAHQTKESISLFLVPACFLSLYVRTPKCLQFVTIAMVVAVLFLGGNFAVKKTLNKLAPPQPSVASKAFSLGIAYGIPRTTLFKDIPYRNDSIIASDEEVAQFDETAERCLSTITAPIFSIQLKDSTSTLICSHPVTVSHALKINGYFLKSEPMKYLWSYLKNILEPLRIVKSRYNEIEVIGGYVFSMERLGKGNVTTIDGFDYQPYVDPYIVKSPNPVGLFAEWMGIVLGLHLWMYSLICGFGLVLPLLSLWRRRVDVLDCFGFASAGYLLVSAFVGLVNDRFFIIALPILVMMCGKYLANLISRFNFKRQRASSNSH